MVAKYNIGKKPEDSKNASTTFKNFLTEQDVDVKRNQLRCHYYCC